MHEVLRHVAPTGRPSVAGLLPPQRNLEKADTDSPAHGYVRTFDATAAAQVTPRSPNVPRFTDDSALHESDPSLLHPAHEQEARPSTYIGTRSDDRAHALSSAESIGQLNEDEEAFVHKVVNSVTFERS